MVLQINEERKKMRKWFKSVTINRLKLSMLKQIMNSNKSMIEKNQLRELIGITQIKRMTIRQQKRYSLSEKTNIDDQILFYNKLLKT